MGGEEGDAGGGPRVPIAATYAGPGPNVYALPTLTGRGNHDPRSVHAERPAWSFGLKAKHWDQDFSPGPVHHPDSRVTRVGVDGTYKYSLYGRNKDLSQFKTPGPGTYDTDKAGQATFHQSPRYSFRARTKHAMEEKTPAPNTYALPSLLGKTVESPRSQAPKYSMVGRSKIGGFSEDLTKTPGPGAYVTTNPDTVKTKRPIYSLTGRNMLPSDNTVKPGPGAHCPEKVKVGKSAPAYTFGTRHSAYLTPLMVPVDD